ncbi:MAG: general secretion pathway protein GspK, partial [Pirellulaceae bacterium]
MNQQRRSKSGFVLIVVLVVVMVLALSAYTFSLLMITEHHATRLMGRQIQSRYLVESGVDFSRMFLVGDAATIQEMGGIWDNSMFQNQPVSVNPLNPAEIGRFSVITSSLDVDGNPGGFRFGLTDESTKLNLNTLVHADNWVPGGGRQLLMALPLMTEPIADCIMDWLDADDLPRDFGVEASYYSSQSPPYAPKNGPMDSLEELLLVRGVTPQLLFGMDHNHNGILDLDEQYTSDVGAYDPEMQLGWANYLTLYSKENNLNPAGLQRIYINSDDLDQLYDDLRSEFNDEWSNFIIAYRQNGAYEGDPEEDGLEEAGPRTYVDIDTSERASHTFSQVLDLIDARTTANGVNEDGDSIPLLLESPINSFNMGQVMTILMANLTTVDGDNIPGRINIMQAPRRILESIPGMT